MAINIRRNVPRRHTDKFVGRTDEQNLFLADCADLLKGNDSYCINFYGAGGVGKTALLNQLMKSLDRLKSFKSEYKDVYILYHDFANGINMRMILRQWKGELEKFGCELIDFKNLGGDNLCPNWWLAGEDGLILQMPATLWVTAGRNKLTWAEGIEQRHLNLLTESETAELLKRLSVEENLRGEIIKLAAGYPLFLIELARRKTQLDDEIISQVREEILERILRDLSPTEKTLLQNLSRLISWTDAEARRAIPNFNPEGYRKLKGLSFVQSDGAGKFFLEPALQKILS